MATADDRRFYMSIAVVIATGLALLYSMWMGYLVSAVLNAFAFSTNLVALYLAGRHRF